MPTVSGGEKLEARLKALADKVSNPATLRVGFLEGATYPDGTSVALVAAVQNFGSPSRGIPPRPFFSNMIAQNKDTWGERLAAILKAQNMDAKRALELMGAGIAGQLRESIVNTNAPPLAPATIEAKGFDTPLIDTAHMLQSVDYEVVE